jgi:hypothetical protein
MLQNKNLTQICLSEGGLGKKNGVASKKSVYSGSKQTDQKAQKKDKTKILDELI